MGKQWPRLLRATPIQEQCGEKIHGRMVAVRRRSVKGAVSVAATRRDVALLNR
jgi:hypothetical protein